MENVLWRFSNTSFPIYFLQLRRELMKKIRMEMASSFCSTLLDSQQTTEHIFHYVTSDVTMPIVHVRAAFSKDDVTMSVLTTHIQLHSTLRGSVHTNSSQNTFNVIRFCWWSYRKITWLTGRISWRVKNCTLFQFYSKMKTSSSAVPRSSNILPVTSSDFDSYTALAIAPDHALMVFARTVIGFFFRSALSNQSVRSSTNC